jgi:hypothetical protein
MLRGVVKSNSALGFMEKLERLNVEVSDSVR